MAIQVRGLAEAVAEVEGIEERSRDLSPVLEVLGQDLRTLIDDSFDGSRSPDGSGWAALDPKTLARRRSGRGRGQPKPLIDTSRLRGSIAVESSARTVRFGTNVEYAGVQQFGGGPSRIPARAFLPVQPSGELMQQGPSGQWLSDAEEAIAAFIETGELPR